MSKYRVMHMLRTIYHGDDLERAVEVFAGTVGPVPLLEFVLDDSRGPCVLSWIDGGLNALLIGVEWHEWLEHGPAVTRH